MEWNPTLAGVILSPSKFVHTEREEEGERL